MNTFSFFTKLKQGLGKTRSTITAGLSDVFLGKKSIDSDLFEEIETQLLIADVGVDVTTEIMSDLTKRLHRKELNTPELLLNALENDLVNVLEPVATPLDVTDTTSPFVILVVGVNGSGKTTTIGKLAKHFQAQGKSVMCAAGDTFRAAAIEQLQVWGERNNVPIVAQKPGADSAAVIFDAVSSAKAKGIDIVIADTAGRLHTQSHLMEELKKVKRVIAKVDETAPHEVLLVLDATTGQNALVQAEQFNHAVNVSGIVLTKLDGTAKGGIIFALAKKMKLPIRFIGVGENADDLYPFNAREFIKALFE